MRSYPARAAFLAAAALALTGITAAGSGAAQAAGSARHSGGGFATAPFRVKVLGRLPDGQPKLTSSSPSGLPPSAIASVYNLSGLSANSGTGSGAGAGQVIAIVDAYHDPNALSDLNTWNSQYGYAPMSLCGSTLTGGCFAQEDPEGTPKVNSGWVLEESLDIEWAHAEAPGATIVLVEAASNSDANLFTAAYDAVHSYGATEVSMSFGGSESSSETSYDADLAANGVFYTASSGDSGHGVEYPAASPNVIAVGGTTLNGCSGTSCKNFSSETAWSSSGGGISAYEPIPGYQSSYGGPVVSGASSISGLTGGQRGVPDVSFDANPNTGVSVYDSTRYEGQAGWFTLGGTSVGAPNWAGILAAGAAANKTALQGDTAIYGGGYSTNLRDITSGTNGSCGTDCTAGTGYDLVTGLGSPINYP